MSGIMEKNLPMAEEVTSENLIRTVSGGGNSENMTVEQLAELVGGTKAEVVSLGKYYGSTNSNVFSGGGAYSGNLSEIIGDKTVINSFAIVQNGNTPPLPYRGRFSINYNNNMLDPIIEQETLKNITNTVGVNFDIRILGIDPPSGSQAELFLILI